MAITPLGSSFVAVSMPPYVGIQDKEIKVHVAPTAQRAQSLPPLSRPSTAKVSATAEFTFESIAEHTIPLLYTEQIMGQLHTLDTEIAAINSKLRSFKNVLKGKANEILSVAFAGMRAAVASMPAMSFLPTNATAPNWSWAPAVFGFTTELAGSVLNRNSSISASAELTRLETQREALLEELTALYLEKSEVFITTYVNHTFTHIDLNVIADAKLKPYIAAIKKEENNDTNKEIVSDMVATATKLDNRLQAYINQLKIELRLSEQEAKHILAPLKDSSKLIVLKDLVTRERLSAADISCLNLMVAARDTYKNKRDEQAKSLVKEAMMRKSHETDIVNIKSQQIVADATSEIAFITLDTEIDNVKTQLKETNGVVFQQGKQANVLAQKVDASFARVDADIAQFKGDTEGKIDNLGKMLAALSTKIDELNGTIAAQNERIEEQAKDLAAQNAKIVGLAESNGKRKTEIAYALHEIKGMQSGPVNVHGDLVVKIPISSPATNVTYSSSSTPITISRGRIPTLPAPKQTIKDVFPSSGGVFPSGPVSNFN